MAEHLPCLHVTDPKPSLSAVVFPKRTAIDRLWFRNTMRNMLYSMQENTDHSCNSEMMQVFTDLRMVIKEV